MATALALLGSPDTVNIYCLSPVLNISLIVDTSFKLTEGQIKELEKLTWLGDQLLFKMRMVEVQGAGVRHCIARYLYKSYCGDSIKDAII